MTDSFLSISSCTSVTRESLHLGINRVPEPMVVPHGDMAHFHVVEVADCLQGFLDFERFFSHFLSRQAGRSQLCCELERDLSVLNQGLFHDAA